MPAPGPGSKSFTPRLLRVPPRRRWRAGAALAVADLPPWQGTAVFASSYHAVQLLPYAGGIVLVAVLVVLISSIHAVARDDQKALTGAALVFTAAFASLIFFNYVVQTTFLTVLAARANVRA